MNRHTPTVSSNRYTKPLLLLIFIVTCYSFTTPENDQKTFSDKLIERFSMQDNLAAEKLYLHLDRPYYTAGDSAWLKGYLVNAGHLTDICPSNFIYVELLDQFDSLLVRRKFVRDTLREFKGAFTLPSTLPTGNYCIRAYTYWMRNNDPKYFFMKNLYIWNPIDREIVSDIQYEPVQGDEIKARIQFSQKRGNPFSQMNVICQINDKEGNKEVQKKLITNKDGVVEFTFKNDEHTKQKIKPSIDVTFQDYIYNFKKSFPIPEFTPDYAITFFPEGGNFLAGVQQNIAFKVQNENGFGEPVTGWITDSRGDTLSAFRSEHNGMGQFSITGQSGQAYKVTTRSDKGLKKEFKLPVPEENGFALSLTQYPRHLKYEVLKATNTVWPDTMYIVAHTREQLHYAYPVTAESAAAELPDSIFSAGITHFILCTKQGTPVSERLVFIRDHQPVMGAISADKISYEKRKPVSLDIQLNSTDQMSLNGSYSISITNKDKVVPDSTGDNIYSNLLLTSDLTGYIENPGYYFIQEDSLRNRHLDLVMLTHGWSRFHTDSLLSPPNPQITYPMERGQFITGKVRTYLNKKAQNAFVSALSTKDSIVATAQTDTEGRFLIESLTHTDSTWFMVVATNKNQKDLVEITADEETVPKTVNKNLFSNIQLPKLYQDDAYAQYTNYENNSFVFLKGITVEASEQDNIRRKADLRDFEEIISSYTVNIDGVNLQRPKTKNVLDAVLSIPGTRIQNTPQSYYSSNAIYYMNTKARVFVNTAAIDIDVEETLKRIPANLIAYVDIYRVRLLATFEDEVNFIHKQPSGYTSVTDPEQYYYLVMITLSSAYQVQKHDRYWMTQLFSLGYSLPKERYHPVYETPATGNQKPDLRHTIYWNPSLPVDNSGKTKVRFYTSDQPQNMHVVIEGITEQGKIVRYESDLKRPE